MKKKIAFVGNSALTMMNFRLGIMKSLTKWYDVVMITPQDCDMKPLEGTQIRFIPIDVDCKGTSPSQDIKLYRTLKKIYYNEQFDFVFHYTIKPVIYGSMAASACSVKHISVVTGLGYTFVKRNWLYRVSCLLHRLALRNAIQVWFLNQDDCDFFVHHHLVNPQKAHVIPGEGINTSVFNTEKPLPHNFTFLYFGRMLRYKGVELYIKAAEILKSEYPSARWLLLGPLDVLDPEGIQPEEMEKWVHYGIIDYLGVTKDVKAYIENSSCVVLASYFREGVPRSLMEAAAMKRPLITTNSVGCKDVVVDRVNGLLCQKGSLDDLVDKMRTMLNLSQNQLDAMGTAGRNLMLQKFDEKIIVKEYISALNAYA